MEGLFPALSLISALYTTVSSLNCTTCNSFHKIPIGLDNILIKYINKSPCKGDEIPCSSEEDVCASINISMTRYDRMHEGFSRKTCWKPQYCNISESVSTLGVNISYRITCCTTDGCNPDYPTLKPKNITKNGVLCPACFSPDGPCEANYSMQCTGEEKHCLTFHRKHSYLGVQYYTSGCATENVCKENRSLDFLVRPDSTNEAHCTKVTNETNLPAKNFLWCQICHNCQTDESKLSPYLCSPDDDVCVVERTRTIYDMGKIDMASKRCGKSSECSRVGSIRSSAKTILINTSCCNHNNCKVPFPTLPSTSNKVNGLICPSCFSPNSDRCENYRDLKCIGKETRCIRFTRTESTDVNLTSETLRGCTTKEICKAGSGLIRADGKMYFETIKTDINCTEDSAVTGRITIFNFLMITFTALCVLNVDI